MTPVNHTALQSLATAAATIIANLNGESTTFEVEHDGFMAEIAYNAQIGEDRGSRATAPSWWVESEQIAVNWVYNAESDDDNDTEAQVWLTNELNQNNQ